LWRKDFGAKAADKMMVKLTAGRRKCLLKETGALKVTINYRRNAKAPFPSCLAYRATVNIP